jgi:Pyruvate phosphate dikinase, AMP/ATP-binding domain
MLLCFRLNGHAVLQNPVRIGLILGGFLLSGGGVAGPVDAPSGEVLAEARVIVQQMMSNPRGPYSRIRWFCNDGTVQPPVSFACREHGGGRQHAQYSEQQERLASLGWTVGTIFAPLTFDDLLAAAPREQRLRELALERYLIDIDDGWVLREAQGYRGRVQLEDEQAAGTNILLDAVRDAGWLESNYLLVRELVQVIPHGDDSDLARRIRRAAIELAERDPGAERWRAEIHTTPTAATAGKLRRWARTVRDPMTADMANVLANDLDLQYGTTGRRARLSAKLGQLRAAVAWRDRVTSLLDVEGPEKLAGLCSATADARRNELPNATPRERLRILSVLSGIETEVQLSFVAASGRSRPTRSAVIDDARALLACSYGAGLLSPGELATADAALDISDDELVAMADYQAGIAQLTRVPAWAAGNVRYTFAEALVRYGALDPRAVRFTDDLLRGSPLWMLGDVLKTLARDLAALTGSEVRIAGQQVSSAIALNPGLARGRLRVYETLDALESAQPAPGDIVALPETIAELKPVAGLLTLGEGNALSHVQLLARNFGIPNVAIDFATIDVLKELEREDVVLVVGADGNVVLDRAANLDSIADILAAGQRQAQTERITVPPVDLSLHTVLPLADIHRQLSGKVIGPKAANLGELNRLFPGRVAPAIAVPFGIYEMHLRANGLRNRINAAYAEFAAGVLPKDELDNTLAGIRADIAALRLSEQTSQQLADAMTREFGAPGSYGVFIRSDTNVEDLPQFTGAGLSETLPHVVGLDSQLTGIPRVWASVLSPRALAWRSSLLTNPEQIYASVLVMKSVPSEKSGVLVTSNLAAPGQPGMTVSTAWGVGGAVAGEAAEGLVLLPDRSTQLLFEAKTPWQRQLSARGGVDWVPARSGRVLLLSDIEQLRELARDVEQKYEPVYDEFGRQRPWDIEFGFVDGELTLFQIRPLVERNTQRADLAIQRLRPTDAKPVVLPEFVDLTTTGAIP